MPFNVCKTKTGTKFNDLNANGTRDSGEPGLAGWTINLYKDTGTIGSYDGETCSRFDVTDADGSYSFDGPAISGNYIVCEVASGHLGAVRTDVGRPPSGETLVTNCPGDTNGYAFTLVVLTC